MGTTPTTPVPAKTSIWVTIAKSAGAIVAGGGAVFLTALQNGTNTKTASFSAGAAALATLLGYLAESPRNKQQ